MSALDLSKLKKPSRIFVGSTMELFGTWVPQEWLHWIFGVVNENPQHTFIFLSKRPGHLHKWSPFPDNCRVGMTATDDNSYSRAYFTLANFIDAKVKFISLEPFLHQILSGHIESSMKHINWLIIGRQTPRSKKTEPELDWMREVVMAADRHGVPVFLKDNLGWPRLSADGSPPFYRKINGTWQLRQEIPKGKEINGKKHCGNGGR